MRDGIAAATRGAEAWLLGGGEMGALIRAHDWSSTPLGPPSAWPLNLRTAVRIMLTSRQPMFVWWGEDLVNLYNDPYRAIVGGKHPQALGQPAALVWREIWDQVGPRAESAMRRNEGTYDEALLLIMERHGYREETYYTFSYSPIPSESGAAGGIICANTDDTRRIMGEREIALLQDLAMRGAHARTVADACRLCAEALETDDRDMPFAALYLVDEGRGSAERAAAAGIAADHPAVPAAFPLTDPSAWPIAHALETSAIQVLPRPSGLPRLPAGPWPDEPHRIAIVPLPKSGPKGRTGALVLGCNPFRLVDDAYRSFLGLAAGQIAAAIANAEAYEDERRRAETLAELDRAKTAFFSNVSHEFRTPLTLMLGPLEDTLGDASRPLAEADRHRLDMARRNALRLLKLVNTLLDFSRMEDGRIQASYAPTDLAALTRDLASVFRSAIERAGLTLRVDCETLPEPIHVDRDMWEKIVLNLLSNAFKFTFAGEIAVRLRWTGEGVALSVRDTGTGIPPEHLARVFERFHRVPNARGRSHEGSGIGLALINDLVRLHGGTIDVASEIDRGTTFTVTLPRGTDHLPPDRLAESTRTAPSTAARVYLEESLRWLGDDMPDASEVDSAPPATGSAAPARIVWADDNADMRDYVRALLGDRWKVEAVPDGIAALEAIRRQRPDLVLSDVMMPRLDGFGLLAALRADPDTSAIPVVLLSARAGEESRMEGLQAGADDYVVKPFSARELVARVQAQLSLAALRRSFANRQAEADTRLALAVKSAGLGVWESVVGSQRISIDANLAAMFGLPARPTTLADAEWMALIHPADKQRFLEEMTRRRRDHRPLDAEFRLSLADGTVRCLAIQGSVLPRKDGMARSIGVVRDVTERREHAERQRLLLHELNHRVRNSLATVLSLAQQTAGAAPSVPDFLAAFRARIMALAEAHSLLTRKNWEGASIRGLVEAILAPERRSRREGIELDGPDCDLTAPQALAIVLGLHELATNARKYGALSAPLGRLSVRWGRRAESDAPQIALNWEESGGPPVSPPHRRGFGTRMLTRALAADLDGTVALEFPPEGVRCRIEFHEERKS